MDDIVSVIDKVKRELNSVSDMDGLCYYASNNVCYDLENLNIPAGMFNIREMAELDYDHYFVLARGNGEIKHCLIDLTFPQFDERDNQKLRFFDNWPVQELKKSEKGRLLAVNLIENGFALITDEELYLYLNSFNPNYECFFTLDEIISFKTR